MISHVRQLKQVGDHIDWDKHRDNYLMALYGPQGAHHAVSNASPEEDRDLRKRRQRNRRGRNPGWRIDGTSEADGDNPITGLKGEGGMMGGDKKPTNGSMNRGGRGKKNQQGNGSVNNESTPNNVRGSPAQEGGEGMNRGGMRNKNQKGGGRGNNANNSNSVRGSPAQEGNLPAKNAMNSMNAENSVRGSPAQREGENEAVNMNGMKGGMMGTMMGGRESNTEAGDLHSALAATVAPITSNTFSPVTSPVTSNTFSSATSSPVTGLPTMGLPVTDAPVMNAIATSTPLAAVEATLLGADLTLAPVTSSAPIHQAVAAPMSSPHFSPLASPINPFDEHDFLVQAQQAYSEREPSISGSSEPEIVENKTPSEYINSTASINATDTSEDHNTLSPPNESNTTNNATVIESNTTNTIVNETDIKNAPVTESNTTNALLNDTDTKNATVTERVFPEDMISSPNQSNTMNNATFIKSNTPNALVNETDTKNATVIESNTTDALVNETDMKNSTVTESDQEVFPEDMGLPPYNNSAANATNVTESITESAEEGERDSQPNTFAISNSTFARQGFNDDQITITDDRIEFPVYDYNLGNCPDAGDSPGAVPCAPENLNDMCDKYVEGSAFSSCFDACRPSFCCIHGKLTCRKRNATAPHTSLLTLAYFCLFNLCLSAENRR